MNTINNKIKQFLFFFLKIILAFGRVFGSSNTNYDKTQPSIEAQYDSNSDDNRLIHLNKILINKNQSNVALNIVKMEIEGQANYISKREAIKKRIKQNTPQDPNKPQNENIITTTTKKKKQLLKIQNIYIPNLSKFMVLFLLKEDNNLKYVGNIKIQDIIKKIQQTKLKEELNNSIDTNKTLLEQMQSFFIKENDSLLLKSIKNAIIVDLHNGILEDDSNCSNLQDIVYIINKYKLGLNQQLNNKDNYSIITTLSQIKNIYENYSFKDFINNSLNKIHKKGNNLQMDDNLAVIIKECFRIKLLDTNNDIPVDYIFDLYHNNTLNFTDAKIILEKLDSNLRLLNILHANNFKNMISEEDFKMLDDIFNDLKKRIQNINNNKFSINEMLDHEYIEDAKKILYDFQDQNSISDNFYLKMNVKARINDLKQKIMNKEQNDTIEDQQNTKKIMNKEQNDTIEDQQNTIQDQQKTIESQKKIARGLTWKVTNKINSILPREKKVSIKNLKLLISINSAITKGFDSISEIIEQNNQEIEAIKQEKEILLDENQKMKLSQTEQQRLNQLKGELEKTNKELYEKIADQEANHTSLTKKNTDLEKKISELQTQISTIEKEKSDLNEKIIEASKQQIESNEKIREAYELQIRLKNQVSQLEAEITKASENEQKLQDEVSKQKQSNEILQKENQQLNQDNENQKKEITKLTDELKDQNSTLTTQAGEFKTKEAEFAQEKKNLETLMQTQNKEILNFKKEIEDKQEIIDNALNNDALKTELNKQLAEQRRNNHDLSLENNILTQKNQELQQERQDALDKAQATKLDNTTLKSNEENALRQVEQANKEKQKAEQDKKEAIDHQQRVKLQLQQATDDQAKLQKQLDLKDREKQDLKSQFKNRESAFDNETKIQQATIETLEKQIRDLKLTHNSLISDKQAAEEQTKAAEEQTKAAEEAKQKAEDAKNLAEEAQKKANDEKKLAEERATKAAEDKIKAAEDAKNLAEEAQKTAELENIQLKQEIAQQIQSIKKAENEKNLAEDKIKAAEDKIKAAEAAQKKAEEAKNLAEEAQKKANDEKKLAEERATKANDEKIQAESQLKSAQQATKAAEDKIKAAEEQTKAAEQKNQALLTTYQEEKTKMQIQLENLTQNTNFKESEAKQLQDILNTNKASLETTTKQLENQKIITKIAGNVINDKKEDIIKLKNETIKLSQEKVVEKNNGLRDGTIGSVVTLAGVSGYNIFTKKKAPSLTDKINENNKREIDLANKEIEKLKLEKQNHKKQTQNNKIAKKIIDQNEIETIVSKDLYRKKITIKKPMKPTDMINNYPKASPSA